MHLLSVLVVSLVALCSCDSHEQNKVVFNNYGCCDGGGGYHGPWSPYYYLPTVKILSHPLADIDAAWLEGQRTMIRAECHDYLKDIEFTIGDSVEAADDMWAEDGESYPSKYSVFLANSAGLMELVDNHRVADLSDAVTFSTWYPLNHEARSQLVWDGHLFGLPVMQHTFTFFVNGVTPTFSTFAELDTQVTNDEIDLRINTDYPGVIHALLGLMGVAPLDPSSTATCPTAFTDAVEDLVTLGRTQAARGVAVFSDSGTALADWEAGTINTLLDGSWIYATLKDLQPATTTDHPGANFAPFRMAYTAYFNPWMNKGEAMAAKCVVHHMLTEDFQNAFVDQLGSIPVVDSVIADLAADHPDVNQYLQTSVPLSELDAEVIGHLYTQEAADLLLQIQGSIDAGTGTIDGQALVQAAGYLCT